MVDLSNKELLIPYGTYQDMIDRVSQYKKANGKNPSKVALDAKNKNDYLSFDRLSEMSKRVNNWKAKNPSGVLKNVWVKPPAVKTTPTKKSTNTGGDVLVNIRGKKHKLKNFTEFYNLMAGFGYSYYYNDILSLQQEISALTSGKAMNCTDFSQLGVYVAKQFVDKQGKKVYSTKYRHMVCKSGGGHTQFEILGGEFTKWTVVDLAARADKKSKSYPLGTGWCMDGRLRGYNESWVIPNKGK